ncbi:MAG: DedA family protein [Ktedonobacterales bacterium]|nr:DedA family protein [Ktedonobacterales bacterium]
MFTRLLILGATVPQLAGFDGFLQQYGVFALFVLVLLQDVGVPTGLPGTALVLIGGYLVYIHAANLHVVALAIASGAFIGASGMFFLARYGGRPLVLRLGRFVGLTEQRLDGAAGILDRWGPPMLLITRVAPGTRVYMTIFAGISGWTYRRFALWTGIFVLLWSYTFVSIGASLGHQAAPVGRFIGRFGITALIVIALFAVAYYGLRWLLNSPGTRTNALVVRLAQVLAALGLARFFQPIPDDAIPDPSAAPAMADVLAPALAMQVALPLEDGAPAVTDPGISEISPSL